MKITVQRSGGVAGMAKTWTVQPQPPEDTERWQPLIEACPWDAVAGAAGSDGRGAGGRAGGAPAQPDRFMYSIRADRRRAVLAERELTGPWRHLVDCARAAAEQTAPTDP